MYDDEFLEREYEDRWALDDGGYGDDFEEDDWENEPIFCDECGTPFVTWRQFDAHSCALTDPVDTPLINAVVFFPVQDDEPPF